MASQNFTVIGFDSATGKWLTEKSGAESFVPIPKLEGCLTIDPHTLHEASQDQGNYIKRLPIAVLQPGSQEDVVEMVRFCNQYRIQAAPQGARHTTYGQATVAHGLAIDMTFFNSISFGTDTAIVGGGVLWRDFIHEGSNHGIQPASSTPDYLGLTIAGTTSVGGFTPKSFMRGNIADNVRSMKVVTGKGNLVHCSRTENAKLFRAMQGTLGQFGIIVELEIEITPAPKMVRTYTLSYDDLDLFFRDLNTIADRAEVDGVFGMCQPNKPDLIPHLMIDVEYDTEEPDDNHILRDLEVTTPSDVTDRPYLDRALFFDTQIEGLYSFGWGDAIKSWYDMIVAMEDAPQHYSETIGTLDASKLSQSTFLLIFPNKILEDRSSFLRMPDKVQAGGRVCLIDVLDDNLGNPDPDYAQEKLERNNQWAELADRLGGVTYLIGTRTMNWEEHYGPVWDDLKVLKNKFDPNHTLIGAHILSK